MSNFVVVLVPGGLGTTLSLQGTTVWDFSVMPPRFDGMRMIINPALLLPWLSLEPGDLLDVYDDLTQFIVSHGYTKQTDLFLWGYDWRLGMEANAEKLADFVNNHINLGVKKLLFIAHSFGCMVVRCALFGTSKNPKVPLINHNLVEMVVAAGPPMLGMACPFRDLMLMPRLDETFDTLFSLFQAASPSLAAQVSVPINKSLMAVTAQLEGLPLNNIPILSGGLNPPPSPYGAFDWTGWPRELDSERLAVTTTLGNLQSTKWANVNCTIVASQSHLTDTGYVLGVKNEFLGAWSPDVGDGSVLLNSALAYCPGGRQVIVGESHRNLLDDPQTRQYLDGIL